MAQIVLEVADPTRARLLLADALDLKAQVLNLQGKAWDALEAITLGRMALDAPEREEIDAR